MTDTASSAPIAAQPFDAGRVFAWAVSAVKRHAVVISLLALLLLVLPDIVFSLIALAIPENGDGAELISPVTQLSNVIYAVTTTMFIGSVFYLLLGPADSGGASFRAALKAGTSLLGAIWGLNSGLG